MNNKIKIIIAIGIIGIVIMVAGFVMGSGPSSIPAIFSEATIPEGAVPIGDVQTTDVRSIELNLFASKISIKSGENFDLSGSGQYDGYVLNGVLYAGATQFKRTANVFGLKFSVPSKWICGYGSYVLVIPPNAKLDQITINTNRSDVTCDALVASQVNINIKNGDLSADKLTADTASINVDGTTSIASSEITRNGNIASNNRLLVGTSGSAMDSTMSNTTLSNKHGGITLYAKLMGSASLQTSRGNIEVALAGTKANYTFPAAAYNLKIHESVVPADARNSTEQYGTISVTADRGNASISFETETESQADTKGQTKDKNK